MQWLHKDRGLEAGFPNICSHYCDCSHLSLGQKPCFQLSPDNITLFFSRLAYGLFCDRYEHTFLLNIIYIPSILVSAWDPGINCPQIPKDYCPSSHTFLQVMQTLPSCNRATSRTVRILPWLFVLIVLDNEAAEILSPPTKAGERGGVWMNS